MVARWKRWITYGLLLSLPITARADMFQDAREAITIQPSRYDAGGMTLRGGIGLSSGAQNGTTTLFRGSATTGGGCGNFDFRSTLQQAFEEIPALFESLLDSIISAMPMLLLCYASPTLCQLSEHYQNLINVLIQHKYAQCQQIQLAAMGAGRALRGGEDGRCLDDKLNQGIPLKIAMDQCSGQIDSILSPLGIRSGQVNLVDDTLNAAGATQEVRTFARNVLGDVTMTANGALTTQTQRPNQKAFLARYEEHKAAARTALETAVQEWRDTGAISEPTLRAASGPGQPTPRGVIEALSAFGADPINGPSLTNKITTAQAIEHLTWECHEMQEALEAAADENHILSPAEKDALKQRYVAAQRMLIQLTEKTNAGQTVGAAFDAAVQAYTALQASATRVGILAPAIGTTPMPYGVQQPSGLRQ